MSASPVILGLQKHPVLGKGQLWKFHDHLADKEGFRHNVYWVTGDQYCGYWSHNRRDGIGIHTYKDGNRYEGEWKNGKREGQGTYSLVDGNKYKAMYRGSWKGGQWHGKGTLYGKNGEIYNGEFENGKRCGYGKQTYWCEESNAYEVYVGRWLGDKREGMGTLYMVDGDRYEGSFMNDKKEGKGIFFFSNKCSKYDGLWKADTPVAGIYTRIEKDSGEGLPFLEISESNILAEKIINEFVEKRRVGKEKDFT